MENNLEEHYNLVQKEIFNITENIYKVKNKNHRTMSKIVENLKYFSNQIKPLEGSIESNDNIFLLSKMNFTEIASKKGKKIINNKNNKNIKLNKYLKAHSNNISSTFNERINTNTNYKKYQPIIHLYNNYINNNKSNINFNSPPNKKHNNTIDNCVTITKDKFFYNRTQNNVNKDNNNKLFFKDSFNIGEKNIKQNKNNYINNRVAKTIDFNNNFNNNKTIQTEGNKKFNKKIDNHEVVNFNKNINNNNLTLYSKNKFRDYYWNNECEKLNDSINNKDKDKIKNNIFFGKYNKSTKNLYKKKINSFKENSCTYFKKIPSKKKAIIDIKKINNKYNTNKSFNEINNNNIKKNIFYNKKPNTNKHHNNYNSIDIENIKITNTNILSKDKYFDIKIIEKIKKILNCENYEQCLRKIKEFSDQKQFMYKILKIYHKYNKENEKIEKGDSYENIILWINYLIYASQKNKTDNKYENFCKQLMKENNITNFSIFRDFSKNIFNEKKNANIFLEDIKKILSVEDFINKENNNK